MIMDNDNMYFCTRGNRYHYKTSRIGQAHMQYAKEGTLSTTTFRHNEVDAIIKRLSRDLST